LPTVFTLYFAVFKIFSIILQVVDFPFVPVIEIIRQSLLRSKNTPFWLIFRYNLRNFLSGLEILNTHIYMIPH